MQNNKHLVFVVRHFFPFTVPSGVTSLINEMVLELVSRETVVSVICLKKENEKDYYNYKGVNVYKFSQFDLRRYKKLIHQTKPSAVIFVSSMHIVFAILVGWYPLVLLTNKKNLFFYQATNFTSVNNHKLFKRFLTNFKAVFSASDAIKEAIEQVGVKSKILYPGTNLDGIEGYACDEKPKEHRIGFFGHMTHIKGVDIFIELAERMPNVKFTLAAGKGKTKSPEFIEEMGNRIEKSNNIDYFGFIDNPLEVMSKCTILVLPYRGGGTILGVAQSAIEAMSMGIPVIGTNNSALSPLIINGKNGYICDDIEEIQERVEDLLADYNLYSELSRYARMSVRQKFDIKRTINFIEKQL